VLFQDRPREHAACQLTGTPDQQRLVEPATPLPAQHRGSLGVVGEAAQHGRGQLRLRDHSFDLGDGAAIAARVRDDDDSDLRTLLGKVGGQSRDALPEVGDVFQGRVRQKHDHVRLTQQVGDRAGCAEPPAVGDDVDPRDDRERSAQWAPQPGQSLRLFGVAHSDEDVESARQPLGVRPDLFWPQALTRRGGQGEQALGRVEHAFFAG
jgi:hypothetical protein